MTLQYSAALRTAQGQLLIDALFAGEIRLFNGALPADCAAANAGTALAAGLLPLSPNPAATVSGGVVTRAGTWAFTGAVGAGAGTTVNHYRLYQSGGTVCVEQGSITVLGGLAATCAATAGNTSVTAPANAIPNGSRVTGAGAGIQADTVVVSGGGTTTLVLNRAPLITNAAAALVFTGTMTLDNPSIASGQTGTIATWSRTMPGA